MSRDNLLQSSTVRNFNDREEFRDSANNALVVRSFDLPEDPSFWKDHNVQVIIRLRPLNNSEISLQGQNRCVRQESSQSITWTRHPESRFTFDVVADENVTQEKLFKVAGVPMVENCVAGYNSCMFAYGQVTYQAIVNEDASGDVLAMRMQIQQLKKEVSHLRSLQNGGAGNQDNDVMTLGFLGSPGAFKWEGLNGSVTPLTSNKRLSQKKEIEVALVGAFRREKDKDMEFQALTAKNQTAMQLAKQRQDEIQGLKMRLRFREAGIKRLEVIASGKISAETHLLKEKKEHLKEIEVLRAQVNKNQEVTRFAMENLRLKEEIRSLSVRKVKEKERPNRLYLAEQVT